MIHKGLKYFIALLLLVHCLGGVFAQNPGRVDTLFNPMMGVGFTGNSRISYVSDGIELPDGSVVVVGNFTAAEGKSVGRIAKFDSDGKLDPSFNSGNAGANGVIYTIKRQTDGKFIIGGDFTSYNGTARNRLVRINADGSLDNTFNIGTGFNGGGVYSIYLPCDSVGCDSVLTVGGYFTNYNGTSVSHIVRLTTNGTRDASFSTTASGLTYIQSIACQSTGKYIIMGYTPSTGSGVRRLNADGTLDDTFNPGGLGARYPGTNHYDYSAIVLPDDKIILGGNFILYDDSTSTDSTANRLVRLHSNGIRDNSFNIGTGFNNIVRSIYRYPNGKIVVTGNFSSYNGISVNRVVCIDTTGSVDSTFSIGTGLNDVAWRVFPGASKLYFAGQFNTCNSIARLGFVRVNTNGSIDNSFLSQSGLNGRVLDVAIQADGKVILVGQFNRYNNNNVGYLVRLNVNGTIDGSFNASGAGANGIVRTVEVLPSGKILIGGDFGAYNGTTRGRIALLNTDGTLDNSVFASGANNFITDIAVSPNGKIYVGGNFGAIGGGTRSRVACYNPDFTLNNSGVGSGALNGTVYHIAFQNDNRVLLSGGFGTYKSVAQGQLICIDTLGNIDSTFYKGTGLTTSFSGTNMRFQKDGKILLSSGNINYNGVPKGCYARLNTDGTLDNTYTSTHTGNYYGGYDIYELGSGILVGGDHLTLNGQSNMGFGYVNKDGSANTEFYGNGGICGLYNLVAVRTIPDNIRGRILIVGEFSTIQNKLSPYFASLDNYINELDISPTLCAGAATKLYFNKGVTFNSDNIFTVQLSDESGSFASPVEIGRDTTDGWGPDSVQVSVPTGTSYGTGYRVRVVSTSPVFTSLSTGPITINASPTQKTVLHAQAAVYPSLGTEVKVVASQTGVHYSLISDTTVVDTGNGSGDTLRLRTGSIYNPKNFVVKAQLGGCSLVLDTVSVDTLGLMHVEWNWLGFTKNPDNSINAEPEPGDDKMEGKSYNLIKRGKDGFVSFDLQSDNDYAGYLAFGDYNSSADVTMGFLLAQDTTSGPDTAGLYLMLEKDEFIPLCGLNGTALNIAVHKHGNIGGIYVNGLLQDTTITWPDTLDFDIELACFASGSTIKSVKTSYTEYLRWNELQPTHANCGSTGSAMVSALGGIPPYHFNWSNGDTTDTPDSLTVGTYYVTVTDFVGDTLIDSVDIVYNAMMDTAHNVGPDSLGRMVSSGFTEFFSSYCWYINTLAVGQDGWIRFDVPEGTNFQGYVGFSSNTLFDESHSGFGIMALGNSLYVTGDYIEGMTYLGSYEAGQKLSLKMRFEGDYLYCGKEEEWGTMEMSFYLPRTTIFRPGVVQLAEGSIYPNVATTFSCDQMFTHVNVVPTTDISAQGQIRIDIKGGNPPYAYLWSNSANTPTINVLPGIYTVTVSDANSTSITAQAFVGTYVEWLAANNVEETAGYEIVGTANTPGGYGIQHNYIFGAQALAPGQDGCFSFDFARAGDFAGTIGVSTDYLMTYGSQGFGLVIVQDRMDFGIDPEIYYVDEEGQMQYFGSFTEQMPMNIKIKKTGTFVEVVKNDIGGISREYTDPLTFRPIISPVFAGDKITRVTANVGVPLQSIAAAQPASCGGGNLGSISLDVRGGQPPYHFNWSNGDTTSTPDSLAVGLYTVQIWDAQLDTIVDSIYIGYGMDWDTTFNVGDTLGMLISTGNNSTESFDSYAYALNSLAPGEDGWVEFEIPQNTVYNGAMAMNANKHYDETTEGIGINIVNGYIIVRGSMISGNTIMAPYKQAAGYRFRIEFNGSNIDVIYKDLLGLAPGRKISVNYTRTQAWSPTIIFGLNGAKISSISSSFGCGGMHADVQLLPAARDGNTGSIYSQVKGGFPPYTYTWSNSSSSANLVNVPIGNYSLTVQDQSGATQVVNTFLGRYTDWDVLSGMAEVGNGVVYEGDTVDFDSTIVSFAIAKNAIKPGASGTVSFDFEKAGDFVGAVGLSESADLSGSQDGALAVVGLIDGDLYILDENGDPAFFGKLRENLPVNILVYKTPTDFTITKNNLSSIIINRATTGYLSPVVIPGFPGDKVLRVTCDFGRKLSIKPIVTPIACGTTNTGSITVQVIGGIPPYRYHWNTGDTTDVNDSLVIGEYTIIVTDSIGDSTVANVTMGYGATWSSLVGVTAESGNSLFPTLPFSVGSAYAMSSNTLYPVVGENGWIEFVIGAGTNFNGYLGLVNKMPVDGETVGTGILINEGHIFSSSTDPNHDRSYLGTYNVGKENIVRISKYSGNEIEFSINGITLYSSEYAYPMSVKPVVYLNSEKSKVERVLASFCNSYTSSLIVTSTVYHHSKKHDGAIYFDVAGGVPPYTYTWADISLDTLSDPTDSIMDALFFMGIDTTGVVDSALVPSNTSSASYRTGLLPGSYTCTITDNNGNSSAPTNNIGTVSTFVYTVDTIINQSGLITKAGQDSWGNNVIVSLLPMEPLHTGYFEYQIVEEGDFDFGFRDIPGLEDIGSLSLSDWNSLASEYYHIAIRSGSISYYASNTTAVTSITTIAENDILKMEVTSSEIVLKKNGLAVLTKTRDVSGTTDLYNVSRIFNNGASFQILGNIIY